MANLVIFVTLLGLGYFFGRYFENRHYQSIIRREAEYRDILLIASRLLPVSEQQKTSILVMGSVVVSVDYFKRFLASLRSLFGGRLMSYETLLDRARREAVLRMKNQADNVGAEKIFNIKYETSSISKNARGAIGSVEVLVYGTAIIPQQMESIRTEIQ